MLNDCGAWSYNGMWTIVYYASFNLITGLDVLQDGDTRSCINLDSLAANPLHFLPPFFTKWKKHSCQNSRCCLPSMSLERRVVEQGVYYYFLVKFACLLDCLFVFVYKSVCLFFLFAFFPYSHLGVVWKISSQLHIKCQSCLYKYYILMMSQVKRKRKCMSFTSSSIVNTLMPPWRYAWLDMIVQYHFIHMFCMFYGCRSTPVSTVNILSVVKKFPSWNIEYSQYPVWMTRKPRKEDFRELTVKSKKSPAGVFPQTPLTGWKLLPSALSLGNQSLFILHPCLL